MNVLINALFNTLSIFLTVIEFILIARVVISWLPISKDHPAIEFLYTITEPILSPIRKLIQKSIFGGKGMMLDFSPLIAFLIIDFINKFLRSFLERI